MANIFFDFDGTLIDPKPKLFQLFSDLALSNKISFDDYWNLKREKISNEWILENKFGWDKEKIILFKKKWMINVETEKYLSFDKIFPFTNQVLSAFKNQNNLFVVTGRQFASNVRGQIENFGLNNFFKNIFVTEQKFTKNELIVKNKISLSEKDIFVGDSEEDIVAAKELGIVSVGVLTGVRNKNALEKFNPDFIFENIESFYQNHFTVRT